VSQHAHLLLPDHPRRCSGQCRSPGVRGIQHRIQQRPYVAHRRRSRPGGPLRCADAHPVAGFGTHGARENTRRGGVTDDGGSTARRPVIAEHPRGSGTAPLPCPRPSPEPGCCRAR